jgi:8-amino-7-oxononanoate synthase
MLCGASGIIERTARDGEARVHTSPPSVADIAAAKRALTVNHTAGDTLRARIVRLVEQLRMGAKRIGMQLSSLLPVPMQTIAMPSLDAARTALAMLAEAGVRVLATRSCSDNKPSISLLITARHAPADIVRTLKALTRVADMHYGRVRQEAL